LKIAIDGRFALGPHTGVVNYLINLVENLARIDDKNEYIIYLNKEDENGILPDSRNFSKKVLRAPSLIWKNVLLPLDLWQEKVDIVHFPSYTIPVTPVRNCIVTIHDVIHKIAPKWFNRKELFLLNGPIRHAARNSRHIIAVSENTAQDIVNHYHIERDKIDMIYEAASDIYQQPISDDDMARVKEKYQIDSEFILYIGVLFARRNIDRLINAFGFLKNQDKLPYQLFIVGQDRGFFDIPELLKKNRLENSVRLLGHVDTKDMPVLYKMARVFIYPSLYEGFGLPILEAMAVGTPVITSRISSMGEIAGEAALLVDPYSESEITSALRELVSNEALRKEYIAKGKKRSNEFSWEKAARETLKVYEKAAFI